MEPECKSIIRVVLPAVRASVAESLQKKYKLKQKDIASKIGVVQVAISKYLNNNYSKEILQMKEYINKHRMNEEIIKKIVEGESREKIDSAIDQLCDRLIEYNVA